MLPTLPRTLSSHTPIGSGTGKAGRGVARPEGAARVFSEDLTLDRIYTFWRGVREEAGLPGLRINDCRHSFAGCNKRRRGDHGRATARTPPMRDHGDLYPSRQWRPQGRCHASRGCHCPGGGIPGRAAATAGKKNGPYRRQQGNRTGGALRTGKLCRLIRLSPPPHESRFGIDASFRPRRFARPLVRFPAFPRLGPPQANRLADLDGVAVDHVNLACRRRKGNRHQKCYKQKLV